MAAAGWELYLDNAATNPHDESHVLRMIAAGLPDHTLIREAGASEWRGLRTHAPFAVALEARGRGALPVAPQMVPFTATPQPATRAPRSPYAWAIPAGVGVALGCVVVAIGFVSLGSPPRPPVAQTVIAPEEPKRSAVVAPPPLTPVQRVTAAKSLADAIAVTLPLMTDTPNTSSPGSALLALWAIGHLTWKDVAVVRDETSYAKARKDIDAERGKRLCVGGLLVQIEAERTDMGTVYFSLLTNDAGNIYHLTAVRSTGDLVAGSVGRFCGVLTGLYDYANSGGGTGHAVDVVGMFDLPDNRK